ncbi:DMT family transporter [Oligoflexia bacterium]|nr:DMT family transporter [Oligoflexia bacterium]
MSDQEQIQREHFRYGTGPMVIAATLWGVVSLTRKLVIADVSPQVLNCLNSFLMAAFLILAMKGSVKPAFQTLRANILLNISHAIFGGVLAISFYYYGLARLELGITILLMRLEPMMVLILARIFLGEKLEAAKYPFMALTLMASYFLVMEEPFNLELEKTELEGISAIMAFCLCLAISAIIGKKLVNRQIQSRHISFLRFFITGLLLLPIIAAIDGRQAPQQITQYIFVVTLIGAGLSTVAFLLYYHALRRITVGVAAFIESIIPIVALVLGGLVLDERLAFSQWLAIPVLLLSVYKIQKHRSSKTPGGAIDLER